MTPAPASAIAVTTARATRPRSRLSLGTVLLGAVVVTLLRPVSWGLGLLGFLAGGGLLLVAWPIVVLPTLTGLQNALGGPVSTLVFGAPSTGLLAMIVAAVAGGLLLVLVGTVVGAWAERHGIEVALEAADEDGLRSPAPDLRGAPGTWRVAVVRLLALAPVAVVVGLVSRSVYDATYRELLLPQDLVTPLPLRVVMDAPQAIVAVLVAWIAADAAGAVGVRRLVLDRRPVLVAWLLGWADLVRRPQRLVPIALLGLALLLVLVAPSMAAASIGWERIRAILAEGRDPLLALAAVLVWVAIWLGGLVLAGVAAAARSAAWTLELPMPEWEHGDPAEPSPS